jgi:hypothetical protein
MDLSKRENIFFKLATVGGKDIEDAYCLTYRHKTRNSQLVCLKRKRKNKPELFEAIQAYKAELFEKEKESQRQAVIKTATKNALTAIEKREELRKIITAEIKIDQFMIVDKGVKVVKRDPSPIERMRAIELDNRMAGDFAPTGIKHTGLDPFVILMSELAQHKNKNIAKPMGEDHNTNLSKASNSEQKPIQ